MRIFIDYNQNARDRTIASAYSARRTPRATVSTPLTWDELVDADPDDFTIATVPDLLARRGDPMASLDDVAHVLDPLLELAARDEASRRGRPALPAELPEDARRTEAGAAEPLPIRHRGQPPADRPGSARPVADRTRSGEFSGVLPENSPLRVWCEPQVGEHQRDESLISSSPDLIPPSVDAGSRTGPRVWSSGATCRAPVMIATTSVMLTVCGVITAPRLPSR